ncbi:MAG: FAD-dependent oxidoreductase [Methanobacterium sp.]
MMIRILGAGLAGLSAAINLAKAGYEVDVFEKTKFVAGRFHEIFKVWKIGQIKRIF